MFDVDGRAFDKLGDHGVRALMPSARVAKVTKDDDARFDACRALWVGTPGTATLVQVDDTVVEGFPLLKGLNPICVQGIKTGGTADDIWALY